MRIGRALRDRPLKYDLIAWPVVGMGDVEQVEPQKLLARAADDLAEAVVDRSEDAIQIDLAETGHGLRDERRKLLLVKNGRASGWERGGQDGEISVVSGGL